MTRLIFSFGPLLNGISLFISEATNFHSSDAPTRPGAREKKNEENLGSTFSDLRPDTAALSAPFAHADLRPSSEPAGDDADAFGGPPHSIAFHSNRDGNNEVYVMNADGSGVTQLTFTLAPGVSAEAAVR